MFRLSSRLLSIIGGALTVAYASSPALAAQTGYPVGINIPLTNNNATENPKKKPLIIIARCNATVGAKDIEGWVGKNNAATVQDMVASLSGNGRQTITFVVPWQWYYRINVSAQPNGGIPAGGVCTATAWWSDTD
jgi:hypothetical protein